MIRQCITTHASTDLMCSNGVRAPQANSAIACTLFSNRFQTARSDVAMAYAQPGGFSTKRASKNSALVAWSRAPAGFTIRAAYA